jgi:hypothetical protein
MRKLMILPLAAMLLAVTVAPVAAAPNVSNFGFSTTFAEAYGDWGYLAVTDSGDGAYAELSRFSESWIQCTGAETPDDETDDTYGLTYESMYGSGPASLEIGKSYVTASASATLDVWHETFNECTGESTSAYEEGVGLSLALEGTGSLARISGHGSFHIPGEINSHQKERSVYRFATGTVELGGASFATEGAIGKATWQAHDNG